MAEYLQQLPLYHASEHARHINLFGKEINKGLLFDRWFGGYDTKWKVDKLSNNGAGKHPLSWLEGECGNQASLERFRIKQLSLINQLDGSALSATLDWHMVTGTGEAHPLENGFLWHHNLATPYLPASSIKGMLRTWLTIWAPKTFTKEELLLLLGNERESDTSQIGNLILFDATPLNCPELTLDIMTPHCGDWYQQGATSPGKPNAVPADWQSPTPISFLAVKKANFLFSMAARDDKTRALLPRVNEALAEALSVLGIGAKTAVGYGLMQPIREGQFAAKNMLRDIKQQVNERKEKRRNEIKRQSMSVNRLKVDDLEKCLQACIDNKAKENLNKGIAALVHCALDENWVSDERLALSQMIKVHSLWHKVKKKEKAKERKALLLQLEE
ncbi:type III-B CRISPR module RAMP protein Cmr6 [uncultured Shewanella sp.]|uniref:type III-B CRISPR module RAMP protein Cmr6 n=1 Tax=uncultured Shewanella sp. TaxID=173975 RepID=UPI00260F18D9|nr:type III-B CRISPR module RAMP protein Cmr6 [uncultured Shewanella sp.]